jgi:hypothetical protein
MFSNGIFHSFFMDKLIILKTPVVCTVGIFKKGRTMNTLHAKENDDVHIVSKTLLVQQKKLELRG